ncbi:CHAT domain-containing protein [Nocardia sp. NPDC020380]|uniref:CHAT domain-containing protein n=1 Tax=Nocardia sp. NPDC020380 TaxID=3364309 RepID=UPI0037993EE9
MPADDEHTHDADDGQLSSVLRRLEEAFGSGDRTVVGDAIEQGRRTLGTVSGDQRGTLCNYLAYALRYRFGLAGAAADLDDAVVMGRKALDTSPVGHPARAMYLSNLGDTLRVRFELQGTPADLDEAIRVGREAIDLTATGNPDRADYQTNLVGALQRRFEWSGAPEDLDEAIRVGREAVDAAAGNPESATILTNLGGVLQARFARLGRRADLDKALALGRKVLSASDAGHPNRALYESNLAGALQRRFDRTGALPDLNEAVQLYRHAADTPAIQALDRAIFSSNLGSALRIRFDRTRVRADLDNAVDAGREAVDASPIGHPNRAMYLSNLGNSLGTRFEAAGAADDLDEAAEVGRKAVEASPVGYPDRAMYLSNLGSTLRIRFDRMGVLADLDEAVAVGRKAVDASAIERPDRAVYLANLGDALTSRFEQSGLPHDLDQAINAFQEAVDTAGAAPSTRIRAARTAGRLVAQADPARAARLFEGAVRLLPEVAARSLERADQQYALGGFAGLAADAAALALQNPDTAEGDRPESALQLLEAGRGVLLSQALHVRSDLSDLAMRDKDLADRFGELRDLLDHDRNLDDAGYAAPDRHQLAGEFENLLGRIRELDGFASFALPPTRDELLAAAAHGPIVAVNISEYRCDALLLSADGVTGLRLRDLSAELVTEKALAFHRASAAAQQGTTLLERYTARAQLNQILEWLWDAAAGPVLDKLNHEAAATGSTGSRIWWMPGGLLSLLPIHAAGHHSDPAGPAARTVIDRVVSSYTPTIAALRHARRVPDVATTAVSRALIVMMPTTPGRDDRLDLLSEETRKLATRLPESVTLVEPDPAALAATPSDTVPTKANVLAQLPACTIAHFACHGASDPADPSQSQLLLHDHRTDRFTVAALAPIRLEHAQLAYLSACETALTVDTRLIDEAIHLSSAFQLAGYPHVIATLWAVNHRFSVRIADEFYDALTTATEPGTPIDASGAAEALHRAIRKVRNKFPEPAFWAAHLHAGA